MFYQIFYLCPEIKLSVCVYGFLKSWIVCGRGSTTGQCLLFPASVHTVFIQLLRLTIAPTHLLRIVCKHLQTYTGLHRLTDLQHTDIQTYRLADLQTCRLTDSQTHRLTDLQFDRFICLKTYRHTDLETYKLTDLQTFRHKNLETYRLTDIRHTDLQSHGGGGRKYPMI